LLANNAHVGTSDEFPLIKR